MKIAYIDSMFDKSKNYNYIGYIQDILKYATENNIQVDTSSEYDFFVELYGDINKYDGLMIHLGINHQDKIGRIVKKYPELKIALISQGVGDYTKENVEKENAKLFNAYFPNDIFDYFKD